MARRGRFPPSTRSRELRRSRCGLRGPICGVAEPRAPSQAATLRATGVSGSRAAAGFAPLDTGFGSADSRSRPARPASDRTATAPRTHPQIERKPRESRPSRCDPAPAGCGNPADTAAARGSNGSMRSHNQSGIRQPSSRSTSPTLLSDRWSDGRPTRGFDARHITPTEIRPKRKPPSPARSPLIASWHVLALQQPLSRAPRAPPLLSRQAPRFVWPPDGPAAAIRNRSGSTTPSARWPTTRRSTSACCG